MEALTQPVSQSLRQARPIAIETSCGVAAAAMRQSGVGLLPVIRDERYAGAVTEAGLGRALEAGVGLDDSIEPYIETPLTLPPYATGAEAMRHFESQPTPGAVIVDDGGVIWGLLFPSDLFPKPPVRLRPPSIGGMAAPFGVYLTSGIVTGGPNKWALMASGANLFLLLTVSRILAYGVQVFLTRRHVAGDVVEPVVLFLNFAAFAVLMRLSPISGYHAAEHQVVHAIERGEGLTLQTVARMPRVHPRCGTNLAAGVMLGSLVAGISQTYLGFPVEGGILLGLIVGLTFWRRVGSFAQYWITTRPASQKQLEAGIRSGEQLLQRYSTARNLRQNPWKSLWNSGLASVAAGGWLAGAAILLLFNQLGRLDVIIP
jgi:CBS domain-containing protein